MNHRRRGPHRGVFRWFFHARPASVNSACRLFGRPVSSPTHLLPAWPSAAGQRLFDCSVRTTCRGLVCVKEKRWTVLALRVTPPIQSSACCWPYACCCLPADAQQFWPRECTFGTAAISCPAECEALEGQRVVVVCRPPSSHEYRYAGASRSVAKRVSELLVKNVKRIDVVNPREVDNWVDESDWGDFRELAKAVHADKVVYIELDDFELYKGKTLYQGKPT